MSTQVNKMMIVSTISLVISLLFSSCHNENNETGIPVSQSIPNLLDYSSLPDGPYNRNSLVYSDKGAWFGYGFDNEIKNGGGFTGPFLMTQDNGVWCSHSLSNLILSNAETNLDFIWEHDKTVQNAFPEYLEQLLTNKDLTLTQKLYYSSPYTAILITKIQNNSDRILVIKPTWEGELFDIGIKMEKHENSIKLVSERSTAIGTIMVSETIDQIKIYNEKSYVIGLNSITLEPGEEQQLLLSQSFIFPEHSWEKEKADIQRIFKMPYEVYEENINNGSNQLVSFSECYDSVFPEPTYSKLVSKCILTMQNNWRSAAGELKHEGLFPSYHYKWFNGFWAWDSWKHAAALAQYNTQLAKEQVLAMYDFMDDTGFIADCIYRDTTIENHNYRNTKPPLSAWAVWQIFENDRDTSFLRKVYPMIKKQHAWWYKFRDHDGDSLCEYGSTDGTLVAAKWESGMDNAVRFDDSELIRNTDNAFSLKQESVDLNSYLYAEKQYIAAISDVLEEWNDSESFLKDASVLLRKIQVQFYDSATGWFYDTSLDGRQKIYVMGCEGWIPLWAAIATKEQAEEVMKNMTDTTKFNVRVPLQTLSADNPKFKPQGGYWRGPVWLDQAYFGIVGLRNYGYNLQADELMYKLIHNAEGVMEMGKSIRENYNPITGEGLECKNFSWSASHYLLLLKTR